MEDHSNDNQLDNRINVGVLESSVLQREALTAALEAEPDLHVALASDLRARPEQHVGIPLDVLLLCVPQCDYSINTAALFEQWHRQFPGTGIILLIQRCRKQVVTQLLRSGLNGHLVQWSTSVPFLVEAIRAVRKGQVVLCETTRSVLLCNPPTAALLTEREREIVTMLAGSQRRTRKQVAALLGVSESTVNNHLAHVSDKLNTYGLHNIIACCRESGLIAGIDDTHGDAREGFQSAFDVDAIGVWRLVGANRRASDNTESPYST